MAEVRPAPTREFRSMHMGRQGRPKVSHRTRLGALLHKRRHVRRLKVGANRLSVYPCWFTDENTFGRRHWHVGHDPLPYWLRDQALGRMDRQMSKARIKAEVEGGYRLSVTLTSGELASLESLAPEGMTVQEYAIRALLGLARTGTVCCHVRPQECVLEASRNGRRQTPLSNASRRPQAASGPLSASRGHPDA